MDPEKHLIILVDDEEDIRSSYRQRLEQRYAVCTFDSGRSLLKTLDQLDPSLFIIDWLMPGMDGLTLCRKLRDQRRFDPVPIAFFTGVDPSMENMQAAFHAGAQSFISKQATTDFIFIQIDTLVNYHLLLERFFSNQKLILSVLEHDMANLLTSVTAGVEILAMHSAFRNRELEHQTGTILKAAGNLRTLFLDLTEVLVFYSRELRAPEKTERLEGIMEDLRGYLETVPREVKLFSPGSMELPCDRNSLGRALYYQVRFIDHHLPAGLPITIGAVENNEGIIFTVGARGRFKTVWEKEIALRDGPGAADSHRDLLFIEYVRHAARLHRADFSVIEGNERTALRLIFPPSPDPAR